MTKYEKVCLESNIIIRKFVFFLLFGYSIGRLLAHYIEWFLI